jgi:hypothetical protein
MSTHASSSPPEGAGFIARVVRALPLGLGLLALVNLGPAIWIAVAPHSFFDQIGPFGAYNGHYLGDAAAFQGGLGLALAAAIWWPALRAGALATALASTGLHAINHWIDVNAAHAGTNAGISDAVSLTIVALFTALLLRASLVEKTP